MTPTVESRLAYYRRKARAAAEPEFEAFCKFLGNLWLAAFGLMWLWIGVVVVLGLLGMVL